MITCLDCKRQLDELTSEHVEQCSGLTLQEYALRHGLPLESVIPSTLRDLEDPIARYAAPENADDARAQAIYLAAQHAGCLATDEPFETLHGPVRLLDTLLWFEDQLKPLGFRFRQEYHSADATFDRLYATNRLKRLARVVAPVRSFGEHDSENQRWYAATLLTVTGLCRANYLFLHLEPAVDIEPFTQWCADAGISLEELTTNSPEILLRTKTEEDTARLFGLLQPQLSQIPYQNERLVEDGEVALLSKEFVIDAAHFITDHPDKCANLHGGRYTVRVKILDAIDPSLGFVMDYADLKTIVTTQVIDVLDHRTLNYAVPELTWRSSTELLSIWMWEQLLPYLPNLLEIEIHETQTSYCIYRGPTLEEFQEEGSSALLNHFNDPDLGRSYRRRSRGSHLRVVGD